MPNADILAALLLGQSVITEPFATTTSGHFVLWPLQHLATSSSDHFNLGTLNFGQNIFWPIWICGPNEHPANVAHYSIPNRVEPNRSVLAGGVGGGWLLYHLTNDVH